MKCIIIGVKPRSYTDKNGKPVRGVQLFLLSDNVDTFGKVFKDAFINDDTPIYRNNYATFEDIDQLLGREVNAEWDVETYGAKQVKRLIGFEFLTDYYDLVKRDTNGKS